MKIKLHKHLDKKIWKNDDKIVPAVSDMLLSIAYAYIDYIRTEYNMPIQSNDIHDIFVFGSITQFFYDKQSDIDVCIVLNLDDAEKLFPNSGINKMLKLYYYDWAMVHICKIYGRKIDLNFQDVKQPIYNDKYRRGPIYSLLRKNWDLKPKTVPKTELKNMEIQATNIYKQILNDYKKIKHNGFKTAEIQQFYANLITSKDESLKENCERVINPVYMAIRKFKHDGYINKMRDIAVKKETAKYVLK